MTRKAFLQKFFWRFLVSLALLGLIVYTLYHVFASSSGSLLTAHARSITDYRIVSADAYLFRDESVLIYDGVGVINPLALSGEKVSKDTALAEAWSGYSVGEILGVQIRLDQVNHLIAILENSLVSSDTTLSKAELYREAVQKDYLALRQSVERGEWSDLQALEDSMLVMLNRYQMLIGSDVEIPQALESLKQERQTLLRGEVKTFYNTRSSGYFYERSDVDGYEEIFTIAALEGLTADGFTQLTQAEAQVKAGVTVGKMVYGNRWYLALALDAEEKALIAANEEYSFRFPENAGRELTLSCMRLIDAPDGGGVAVFYTDEVPTDFAYLRTQNVEIVVGSCSGYYVPDSAIHTVDGALGVYVFEEGTLYFRRIEVLYRGDGYCIAAERGDRGEEYLGLNDIMVTSGEDLYEGRVYK